MADLEPINVRIDVVTGRAIVSLKTTNSSASDVAGRLSLANPLQMTGDNPASLWISPNCWLLIGPGSKTDSLLQRCSDDLQRVLHLAVDCSAAYSVIRVEGTSARELLASGCGLDLRPNKYPVGTSCRTRFAQIATIIVALGPDLFELYVDRSFESYLTSWLSNSARINALAAAEEM